MQILSLSYNLITSAGAVAFFNTLRESNPSCEKIYLHRNSIDDACIEAFANFLQNNTSLKHIELSNNKITNAGVIALTEFLSGNTTLQSIGLSENEMITVDIYPYFVDLAKHTAIKEIYVPFIDFENSQRLELKRLLSIPPEERELPIKSDSKSAAKTS